MTTRQRYGLVAALVGLAIIVTSLPFTEQPGWMYVSPRPVGLLDRVRESYIVIRQGKGRPNCPSYPDCYKGSCESAADFLERARRCVANHELDPRPVESTLLPYRYVFALGVGSMCAGVGMILLGRQSSKSSQPCS